MNEEKQGYKSYAANNLMIVLYYGSVSKVKKLGISSKVPLLITDRQILFFNKPKKDPCYWLNINSLSYNDKQIEVTFEGKKEIIFSLPKGELLTVFGIIVDLLRRILTKKQKEKIQLNQYLSLEQKSSPSSGFSLISRFLGNADIHSKDGKNYIETLQAFLMIQSPTISNSYFSPFDVQEEVIPLLLDLLPFIKAAEHFEIVNSPNTFQILTEYISYLDNIVQLSISANQDKENLGNFLAELKSAKASIEGIDFSSISFEEDEFKNICKVIKSLRMCSFGLNSNSISKKYLKSNKFYDDFESNNYLLYLNFSKFFNLNFSKIAPKIRNISILSIANCNIEVSSIFQTLKEEEFPNLSEIDISGNIVSQQIISKNTLPPNLYKIIANKIEWKNADYLRSFFSFIFKQMNSILNLSVSEISFTDRKSDENWDSFFQYLSLIDNKKTKTNSILSFCWNGNKLSSEFFDFLRKCRKLENLSLSYCFKSNSKDEFIDNESISLLCEYLKSAKTIKKLIIRGSNECKLGTVFSKHVVKAIEEMKVITHLDVSNNSIGDDGINSLKNLIKKKQQIETIVFDNSQPQSISPLLNIFSSCMKMSQSDSTNSFNSVSKIKLSFPIYDVYALRESKKVQKKDLKLLKSYCQCMIDPSLIANTNSDDAQIPFPKSSPLDKPYFTFYSFNMMDDFRLPKYIKRGSYHKIDLQSHNEEEDEVKADVDDQKSKRKKREKARSKYNESESDDIDDERTKKGRKSVRKLPEKNESDSYSDKNDSKPRKEVQKRKRKSRDESSSESDEEEDDENRQRKTKKRDKNINQTRRKSDTRFVKMKNKAENSEDDEYETIKYNKNRVKNSQVPTRRNRRRNPDTSSSSENEYDNEERPKLKKKSYDEPIYDESNTENEPSPKRTKRTRKQLNNFDKSDDEDDGNDRFEQKKWNNMNRRDLSKSLAPKRQPNARDNNANNNNSVNDINLNDDQQKDGLVWSFPFQPVAIPADNNSYIRSIDEKYSIVALTKLITNE